MKGRVLVLNQNYEPVSICGIQKAIVLLYLGKAELVEQDDAKLLHSISKAIPCPSIVKLSHYIKIPFKRAILSKNNILRRDSHRCQYCGRSDIQLTVDHIIPKAKNGEDSWENLITACIICNNKKGDRTPEEANMHLKTVPRRPNHVMFLKHSHGTIDEKWKQYLYM